MVLEIEDLGNGISLFLLQNKMMNYDVIQLI